MNSPADNTNAPHTNAPAASIVLSVQTNLELALYGFRSWLIQDFDRPYEVVMNVYNDQQALFEPLTRDANPNCRVLLRTVPTPEYFNISAANNLGLHLSSGKYVLFANADMIYCGDFLTRAIWAFEHHNLAYAIACRINLLAEQCATLKPPIEYTGPKAFDVLSQWDLAHGVTVWPAISPWMIRRDIAFAVGGFDPNVLVAEDRDIDQRVTHYLRRHNLQQTHVSLCNLGGYHLSHPTNNLFDAFSQSIAIIAPRQDRMTADLNSTEDVVPTKLNDLNALLQNIRDTKKPPMINRYRHNFLKRAANRARDTWKTFRHGR